MGTALNLHSRVWFTLSHGILNEVYFPRVDQACTRDLGLIVTDGSSFFSEEKRHCQFENHADRPGVPVYELTNTELQGRYRIEKEVFTDPYRNVVLQKIRFVPLQGKLDDYRLYALLSPHLANCGGGNTGWVGDYKGVPMLFAEPRIDRPGLCLLGALAEEVGRLRRILRRMAGPLPALSDDLGLHPRGERQRRADRRDRPGGVQRRVCAGAGLWRNLGGSRATGALQPAGALRRTAQAIRVAVERLAGQPAETGPAAPRSRSLPRQRGGAARRTSPRIFWAA